MFVTCFLSDSTILNGRLYFNPCVLTYCGIWRAILRLNQLRLNRECRRWYLMNICNIRPSAAIHLIFNFLVCHLDRGSAWFSSTHNVLCSRHTLYFSWNVFTHCPLYTAVNMLLVFVFDILCTLEVKSWTMCIYHLWSVGHHKVPWNQHSTLIEKCSLLQNGAIETALHDDMWGEGILNSLYLIKTFTWIYSTSITTGMNVCIIPLMVLILTFEFCF